MKMLLRAERKCMSWHLPESIAIERKELSKGRRNYYHARKDDEMLLLKAE